MEARERRLAENEMLFRDVNERIEAAALGFGTDRHRYGFLCECANRDCDVRIELTLEQYEHVRAHPARFLVLRGHDFPDIERVVAERDGYMVIEKLGDAVGFVTARDPRR